MKNKFNLLFFFTAALIAIFLIQFVILNTGGNIPLYIFVYLEIFLLFFLGAYLIAKKVIKFSLPVTLTGNLSRLFKIEGDLSVPLFIILTGILFRIILFPAALTTSPDAYRYLWEGKVIINGYNPYEFSPSSPELMHLHSADLPSKINFRDMNAIYPPAAQIIFAAAYLISGESFTGLKILYLVFEILTMIFLLKLLDHKRKDLNNIIYYAWLPLPIMEYFVNAHLDVFGISFFIMAVYFFEKEKHLTASVLFSFSVLAKFLPLFIIPLLLRKAGIKKTLFTIIILSGISIVLYFPFYTDSINIFASLLKYIERWEFNASAYYLLKIFTDNYTARIICMAVVLILVIIISVRYRDFTKAVFGIMISFFILASTVYPWYLGWIAVLNPVYIFYSATSLFFTSNFSNVTPLSPVWTEYTWVLLAEYVTFFLFLGIDLWRNRKGAV